MRHALRALLCALVLVASAACGEDDPNLDPKQVDAIDPPKPGACRVLGPDDVGEPANATRMVDCAKRHTAQTFSVRTLPEELHDAKYDDREVAVHAYKNCSADFQAFLGADESLVMRTVVSWAWFRPSEKAWKKGARWYRCDVVGGGEQTQDFVELPETAEGLLLGRPDDRWMVCAQGETVTGAVKVPCSTKHDWRAVTTIKLGQANDPYPGDRKVEVKTRDYCSDSVHAWLNYPVTDYDYAYTWFHEAEWEAGNRRSVCWAKTGK